MLNLRFPAGERRYWPPPSKASACCVVCWAVYLTQNQKPPSDTCWDSWDEERAKCLNCLGTLREAIPFAELFVIGVKGDFR